REVLEKTSKEVSDETGEVAELANLNCPGQIVLSGTAKGVEIAGEKAKEAGARRVIPLQVSGPFHSSLMTPAAEKLKNVLDKLTIKDASIPVIANVSAKEVTDASTIRTNLIEQVSSPVLWEDTIRTLLEAGVDTF